MALARHHDVARFLPDEPDAVVAGCLSCPYCLGAPCEVVVEELEAAPDVACTCGGCAAAWVVHLDAEQALRLVLAPPLDLAIRRRATHAQPGLLGPADVEALRASAA